MEDFEAFKEKILRDYPRLPLDHTFKFGCNPSVPCFGKCCADVNIFLTPYDVLRMKKALGISSSEFVEKYVTPLMIEENQLPVVVLKMREDDDAQRCPFVSDKGCAIYHDRPWSCRMYPVGLASSKDQSGEGEEFCFIVDKEVDLCKGFEVDREWTIKQWLDDQDVGTYNDKSAAYMQLTLHQYLKEKKDFPESKVQVFFKTCYDLDGFRRMLLESSFFDRFEVDEEAKEQLKTDDEALLEFGITKWLPFALFREDTMVVKDSELEKGAKSMGWQVE